ncbi:MAG: LLM class flavin-dependent oxidoreductase [Cyclonatronaceae bacterium]
MQFGVFSFADNTVDATTGKRLHPAQRLDNLMEEIALADQAGLDVFGIGEHHREEYVASAPPVILAAAASRTKKIRLTSAVTVLGSDDPVRVYQQFATLDLLSGGRAEIMIGRGSFIESFPLFGYNLQDYEELFSEKMDLLLKLREKEVITWQGKHRPSLHNAGIFPQPVQKPIPLWIAVGGTPESAYRAGALGLPMALAIIGGDPARFTYFSDMHRRGAREAGIEAPALSINSHGLIAGTSREASDTAFPAYKLIMDKIGSERGWPPMSRSQFDASTTLSGANFVGSPQQVTEKILYQHELFGHQRFNMQMSVGSMPHENVMRSIELFGSEVVPAVKKALADQAEK